MSCKRMLKGGRKRGRGFVPCTPLDPLSPPGPVAPCSAYANARHPKASNVTRIVLKFSVRLRLVGRRGRRMISKCVLTSPSCTPTSFPIISKVTEGKVSVMHAWVRQSHSTRSEWRGVVSPLFAPHTHTIRHTLTPRDQISNLTTFVKQARCRRGRIPAPMP
jgi:hypothetical protein